MSDLLKECLISAYIRQGTFKATEGKLHASFHTWGTCSYDDKQITIAIVEDVKGKILCVPPDYLEFIENTTFPTGQKSKP
jgi:hypothetical protein